MSNASATQVGGDHYRSKKVQPWDAMESCMSKEEFVGFLRGNVIKYVMRCRDKGGVEDLRKAQHYMTKLLEVLDELMKPPPPDLRKALLKELTPGLNSLFGMEYKRHEDATPVAKRLQGEVL